MSREKGCCVSLRIKASFQAVGWVGTSLATAAAASLGKLPCCMRGKWYYLSKSGLCYLVVNFSPEDADAGWCLGKSVGTSRKVDSRLPGKGNSNSHGRAGSTPARRVAQRVTTSNGICSQTHGNTPGQKNGTTSNGICSGLRVWDLEYRFQTLRV